MLQELFPALIVTHPDIIIVSMRTFRLATAALTRMMLRKPHALKSMIFAQQVCRNQLTKFSHVLWNLVRMKTNLMKSIIITFMMARPRQLHGVCSRQQTIAR